VEFGIIRIREGIFASLLGFKLRIGPHSHVKLAAKFFTMEKNIITALTCMLLYMALVVGLPFIADMAVFNP